MHRLVIADASCLIVLQKIERLELLEEIFTRITITNEVQNELGGAFQKNWIDVENINQETLKRILQLDLDNGEASAITLGLEAENPLLLIDEKKGRKIAHDLRLPVMGTLGVIIKAKERGLVHSIAVEIEKLKKVEFRMSAQLIEQILDKHD